MYLHGEATLHRLWALASCPVWHYVKEGTYLPPVPCCTHLLTHRALRWAHVRSEPTSGLDARAAAVVMRTLRNTVNTGRTVVCTIHQVSGEQAGGRAWLHFQASPAPTGGRAAAMA